VAPIAILLLLLLSGLSARAQLSEPEQLIKAGHWKRARPLAEARLREAPRDALAHFLLSQIRFAFGDRKAPLTLAEQAVALDGGVAKYHRQLAEALGVEAQHAGPIQQVLIAHRFRSEIDRALELDPRDIQALRDLIEFYLLAPGLAGGDLRKAEDTALRIGAIDGTEGLLAQSRIAAFEKRSTESEALLRRAAQAQPPSYHALVEFARFHVASGHADPAAAEAAARKAISLGADRIEPYAILAGVYADRGDWNALDAVLKEASRQNPDDPAPYYRAADHLLNRGLDPARAERYLRVYIGQEPEGGEPGTAEGHWKLGLALQAEGARSEAATEWKEALRLDPASPAAHELKHPHEPRLSPAGNGN
jgi:tetratricopeptide (TPR) repeat protein